MAFTNVIQWNCEGIKAKFKAGDINQLIKETGTNCLCLQETKLHPNANFVIKGFKSYLKNQDVPEGQIPRGGVGVFVRKSVSSYQVELHTRLQAVAASVKFRNRVTVCSLYLPPGEVVSKAELQDLIRQLPKPFLLLGDMNAHHPMWNDPRPVNACGEIFVELCEDDEVGFLDGEKMTHMWKVDKSFSHPDLSLCSTELLNYFRWDVNEEPLNSDHFPILISSRISRKMGGNSRWLIAKADWDLFSRETITEGKIESTTSVNDAAEMIEKIIIDAARKAIPKSKGSHGRASPPWWNGECRAAIQRRKATFRRFRRTTTGENYNSFSRAKAQARRVVKKAKDASWQVFANSIRPGANMKDVWRKIDILNNRHRSELVTTLVLNNKEIEVSNIPFEAKDRVISRLESFGCVQTCRVETREQLTTINIRFEKDEVAEKVLALHGRRVDGTKVTVTRLERAEGGDPVVLDEPGDIADCLGRRFAFISSEISSNKAFREYKQQQERVRLDFYTRNREVYNMEISMDELLVALKIAKESSPGPDEVTYSMLSNLAASAKTLLLEVMNHVFKKGKFPDKWKEAVIVPILKEGKAATCPGSYRPIALTSCVCKLLERILNRRLVWFLESKGWINRYQSGFRKGRSTVDCLAALSKEIHDAFRRSQYVLCVFFDLEKAYDTCWKHLIMKQLHSFGLRGDLAVFIEDYLSGRKFRVRVGSSMSESFSQEMGVPQGGVLSCTLFSIAINTVCKVIQNLVNFSLYVDDKRISYADKSYQECRKRIQEVLIKMESWAAETGFRFSTDKTEWMIFYRNAPAPPPGAIRLTLNGVELKEVKMKMFLGLLLDRLLTFKDHFKYLRGKCFKAMNAIKVISYNSSETDSLTLLRIYRALVRSKLDYACQVYGTAPKSYLKALDPVHHKGIRLSLGAYVSSPVESLYVEANEPRLAERRDMLQMQYYARVKQHSPQQVPVKLDDTSLDRNYERKKGKPLSLGYVVRQLIGSYHVDMPNIVQLQESKIAPWELSNPVVCTALSGYLKKTTSPQEYFQLFMEHRHEVDVSIYTDGSRSEVGVGVGVVVLADGKQLVTGKKLHESASVFTAELYAIKVALERLKHCRELSCVIYTDSRSAIQAIEGRSPGGLVRDILELLWRLKTLLGVSVSICWLPGHAGIVGNEMADKEAKAAAVNGYPSTQGIPVEDVKKYIKRKVLEKVRSDWDKVTVERVKFKEVCTTIPSCPFNLGLSRRENVKLTRLRIGHTRVTHKKLYEEGEMNRCVECEEDMTVKHVLLECGNLALERLEFYDPREVTLRKLLSEKEFVLKVFEFLKRIGWYGEI